MSQEDDIINLNKLKMAISVSSNVKDDIKVVFEHGKIENIIPTFVASQSKIFKLYQARYELIILKGNVNESFDRVLKILATVPSNSLVALTGLEINEKFYIVFSDADYKECLGIIGKQ